MILQASKELEAERIAICEQCPHFRKRSRTCGTPIVGNKVGNKRTCGCFMDIKTKLSFSNCPLDRWQSNEISNADYLEMKNLVSEVTHSINPKQKSVLYEMLSKYNEGTTKTSNCAPCLVKALDDIKEIIRQYEN
tara:strand:- start:300 stop:704 length:405 start_codon:yes stop_codon:yes gene_type:complete